MKVVHTFAEAREAVQGVVGFVPTLGFLHEGHQNLMQRAVRENDCALISIFVNPLQFNDPSDLEAYPRNLDRDLALADEAGVDVVFSPSPDQMYPRDPLTRVLVGQITESMEGANRPGHFEGVSTVVAKLLAGLQPNRAYFGKKDSQQLLMIMRMVADLSFPTEIVPCSTVREVDGLALSSRNVRIVHRDAALRLSAGLFAAAELAVGGERDGAALERCARDAMGGLEPEYVTLASRSSSQPIRTLSEPAFLAVAAPVGDVRLIDNVWLGPDEDPDLGTRLVEPSVLYTEAQS